MTLAELWEASEGPGNVCLTVPREKPPTGESINLPFLKTRGRLINWGDGVAVAMFSRQKIRLKLIQLGYSGPTP